MQYSHIYSHFWFLAFPICFLWYSLAHSFLPPRFGIKSGKKVRFGPYLWVNLAVLYSFINFTLAIFIEISLPLLIPGLKFLVPLFFGSIIFSITILYSSLSILNQNAYIILLRVKSRERWEKILSLRKAQKKWGESDFDYKYWSNKRLDLKPMAVNLISSNMLQNMTRDQILGKLGTFDTLKSKSSTAHYSLENEVYVHKIYEESLAYKISPPPKEDGPPPRAVWYLVLTFDQNNIFSHAEFRTIFDPYDKHYLWKY